MRARLICCLIFAVILGGCGLDTFQTATGYPTLAEAKKPTVAILDPRSEQQPTLTGEEDKQPVAVASIALEGSQPLAARVNGQPIYLATYENQVTQLEQALAEQGMDLTGATGQQVVAQVRRQVLESLIDQLIIEQQAARLGISISDEELKAKVTDSIAQAQSQNQFEAWLAANNLTLEELESTLRSQLIANLMFSHITGETAEVAEQIHVRQIEVADRETASAIIAQLKNGADFAVLAGEYSLDENSRTDGGDLGWLPHGSGRLPLEVETTAFLLEPGQVSGPIPSGRWFHIIKLENREAERPLTNELLQALKRKAFNDWLMEQRSSATIERFIGE